LELKNVFYYVITALAFSVYHRLKFVKFTELVNE